MSKKEVIISDIDGKEISEFMHVSLTCIGKILVLGDISCVDTLSIDINPKDLSKVAAQLRIYDSSDRNAPIKTVKAVEYNGTGSP